MDGVPQRITGIYQRGKKKVYLLHKQLVKIVDTQKQGVQIQDRVIDGIKKKIQRYESFMNSNLDDLLGQSQDNSVFDKFSKTTRFHRVHTRCLSSSRDLYLQVKHLLVPEDFQSFPEIWEV